MENEKIKKLKKNFLEKSKKIVKSNLIFENDKILIAFSGGPDSVFLYYFLNFLKKKLKIELSLVYVNHNLRYDVENDLKFVKKFSTENNINYYIKNVNVSEYAIKNKKSIELAARELRYEAIESIRKMINYDKIATGHNLDDNVETFIFRLLRGTSLNGLKSIPKKREKIIRPILEFEKSEILAFLKNRNQKYIIDYTNNKINYTRNFIRNKIFPDFIKINPDFRQKVHMLIKEINDRETEETRGSKIEKQNFEVQSARLNQNKIIKKDELVSFLKKYQVKISRDKINQIFESFFDENGNIKIKGSKEFYLGKNRILRNEYGKFKIIVNSMKNGIDDNWNEKTDKLYEKVQILKEKQSIKWYNYEIAFYKNINDFKNYFMNNKNINYTFFKIVNILDEKIIVRNRRNGDRIFIKNLGHKKVKKILIDEKITKWKRELVPIIEAEILQSANCLEIKNENMKEKIILSVSDIKFSKFLEKIHNNDFEKLGNNSKILVIGRKNGR